MIDAHTHLEFGPLNVEYVEQFIQVAKEKGITCLHILDHTHRFKQFEVIYEPLRKIPVQDKWLSNIEMKFKDDLKDFMLLKERIQAKDYGIEIKFGLEVCYSKEQEKTIAKILKPYRFDFLVGAVHSIHHMLYDMSFSKDILWNIYDVDWIYKSYYEEVINLIHSHLFTQLAHPDTIKLFQLYPTYDLTQTYENIAIALLEANMCAEQNTGCHYRYNHPDIGLSKLFYKILKDYKVTIITASDAHKPSDVGMFII